MDNSFITSKYAIIFEGKNYADKTKTYSITMSVELAEYTPIWYVDSYKAYPLFYNKHVAEDFVNKIKTSKTYKPKQTDNNNNITRYKLKEKIIDKEKSFWKKVMCCLHT